jgi:hypothetical protein
MSSAYMASILGSRLLRAESPYDFFLQSFEHDVHGGRSRSEVNQSLIMEHHYVIPFDELPAAGAALAKGDPVSPDFLESFAFSMLSQADVTVLRKIVSDRNDGDRAGWACLALYTAGGIGDVSTELRPWLRVEDNGDRIHTAGPVVLASCVQVANCNEASARL